MGGAARVANMTWWEGRQCRSPTPGRQFLDSPLRTSTRPRGRTGGSASTSTVQREITPGVERNRHSQRAPRANGPKAVASLLSSHRISRTRHVHRPRINRVKGGAGPGVKLVSQVQVGQASILRAIDLGMGELGIQEVRAGPRSTNMP